MKHRSLGASTVARSVRTILGAALCFFSLDAFAFDLYVSTSGNDNSSGTQLAPLRTIARASILAKPGTTIFVAPGTYTGNFVTRASGTAAAPIKYISVKKHQAKLVGTGTGVLWYDHGSYIEVDGFDMSTSGRIGFVSTGSFGKLRNNYVHDILVSGGISGSGGAGLDVAGPNWVIHNNIVRNIDKALKTDHRVQGIYLASANNLVYNNVIENVVGQGVNSWHGATRNVVVNNTIINAKFGILMGSGDSGQLPNGSQYNYVANNILINNRVGGIQEGGKTSYNTYVNNLFFNNPVNIGTLAPTSKASGTIVGNPMFVNAAAFDYHLKLGSPAINKGTSDRAPASDFDGKARSGAVDIGAFEFVASAPVPSPTPRLPASEPPVSPSPTPASVTLSATSLTFGLQAVGTTSSVQTVVIKNTGKTSFTIPSAFVITGDFTFGGTGTCKVSGTYAPGASCTASVVFKPTASGLRTGSLTIKTSASATALVVNLKGNYSVSSPTPTPRPTASPTPVPTPVATPKPSATPVALYRLYVSPTGSDSNLGTETKPLKTIARASVLAKPGTIVYVAPGTYAGGFKTSASGTASAPIRYVSTSKWKARIVGTGSSYNWLNLGNFVTVDGFEVTGATAGLVSGPWSGGDVGHHFTATNNYIHDLSANSCGSSGAIHVFSKTGQSVITNNVIRNVAVARMGSCPTMQGIYIAEPGTYVANNLVSGVSAVGIQQWHGATKSTIVNNTVFASLIGYWIGGGDSGVLPNGSQDNYVANNIAYNNSKYNFIESGKTSRNTYVNNLSFGSSKNWSVAGSVSGSVAASPIFVNYRADGTGNYRLQTSSPAINRGLATSAPTADLDGRARPQGGKHDIGAYESF